MPVYGVDMTETADRIARVVRTMLTTEGAAAVSMRRVATAVGITPMAIYRHYPNREALLATVADSAFAELAQRWQTRPRTGDAVGDMHEALDALLDLALEEPNLYHFLFAERRDGARAYPDDFRTGGSPTLNILAEVIGDGMRDKVLREDDVWDVAFTVAAQMQGLILLYQGGRTDPSAARFRALCHSSLERLIHGLEA
jgi:AcrR family transcriptional regulator